jgi:hypothetical protein
VVHLPSLAREWNGSIPSAPSHDARIVSDAPTDADLYALERRTAEEVVLETR